MSGHMVLFSAILFAALIVLTFILMINSILCVFKK